MKEIKGHNTCPNCGRELSPWQQVLLSVDRVLMCKNCWYRIRLDRLTEPDKPDDLSKRPEEK